LHHQHALPNISSAVRAWPKAVFDLAMISVEPSKLITAP
jgi:hypothetical protein